jgi:hypothetical protein
MQNRAARFGPAAMATAVANLINCALTSNSGPIGISSPASLALYLLITHIRLVNTAASAATASLFIGTTATSATAAAFAFNAYSIAANSYVDWYGRVRLDAADFLTGLASATTVTWQAEGEIGIN